MSARHVIDSLHVDIRLDRPDTPFADEAYLATLFRDTMLPVVDVLLDQYDQPGVVLTLPALALDLGTVTGGDAAAQLAQRLRTVLEEELRRLLPTGPADTPGAPGAFPCELGPASVRSAEQAGLEQLLLFLETGRLPWHADLRGAPAHEGLLEQALSGAGAAGWPALVRALQRPASLRRLVAQYPVRLLRGVLRRLAAPPDRPEDGPAAEAVDELIDQLFDALGMPGQDAGSHAAGPARLAWQAILGAGVARAATGQGLSLPQLGGAVAEGATGAMPRPLVEGVTDRTEAPVTASPPAGADARWPGDLAALDVFLTTGRMPAGSLEAPAATKLPGVPAHHALLDRLLASPDSRLWAVLARALVHPGGARRITGQFPQRQLLRLLVDGAPEQAPALGELIASLRHALADNVVDARVADPMAVAWRHVLVAVCGAAPVTAPAVAQLRNAILAAWQGAPDQRAAQVPAALPALPAQVPAAARAMPAWRRTDAAAQAGDALLHLLQTVAALADGAAALPPVSAPRRGRRQNAAEWGTVTQRALARRVRDESIALTAMLRQAVAAPTQQATPRRADGRGGAADAGGVLDDGASVLRQRFLATLDADADAVVPAAGRAVYVAAIDAAALEASDHAGFWRRVAAVVASRALLDLDAIVATVNAGANDDSPAAPESPQQLFVAPGADGKNAAGPNDGRGQPASALRRQLVATITGDAAIDPERCAAYIASLDAAATAARDQGAFWRHVAAVVASRAWLDLDAIVATVNAGSDANDAAGPSDFVDAAQRPDASVATQLAPAAPAVDAEMGPERRAACIAGLDAAAGEANDQQCFWRHLAALVASRTALNLDAIVATINAGSDVDAAAVQPERAGLVQPPAPSALRPQLPVTFSGDAAAAPLPRAGCIAGIDAAAKKARDKPAFWRRVAAVIASRSVLDLDAIVATVNAGADQDRPPGRPDVAIEPQDPNAPVVLEAQRAALADGAARNPGQRPPHSSTEAVPARARPGGGSVETGNEGEAAAPDPHALASRRDADTARLPAAAESSEDARGLRQMLVQALLSGDYAALLPHWRHSLRTHAPLVREAVAHYARSARIRNALVRALPDALLVELLDLLAAPLAGVAATALATPAPFVALLGAGWRAALWSALLANAVDAVDGRAGATVGMPSASQASARAPLQARAPLPNLAARLVQELCAGDGTLYDAFLHAWVAASRARQASSPGSSAAATHGAPADLAGSSTTADAVLRDRQAFVYSLAALAPDPVAFQQSIERQGAIEQQDAAALAAPLLRQGAELAAAAALAVDSLRAEISAMLAAAPALQAGHVAHLGSLDAIASRQPPLIGIDAIDAHLLRASRPERFLRGVRDALQAGRAPDLAALIDEDGAVAAAAVSAADPAAAQRSSPVELAPEEPLEALYIANAGMVLAAPYLPRLFDALGLLRAGVFIDAAAAERAIHLLQFMVTGQVQTPEYALVLNKLLCGLPTSTPVGAGIDITPRERETVEGMLQAMIAHWKAIGNTSVAGLRQSFLVRDGVLQLGEEGWRLAVAPGAFDMLLDRLPWSYAVIKPAWMALPLHVDWR